MCNLSENDLLEKSFKLDQHKSYFTSRSEFSFNDNDLTDLCRDCLGLICDVSEKICNSNVLTNDENDDDAGNCNDTPNNSRASYDGCYLDMVNSEHSVCSNDSCNVCSGDSESGSICSVD